MRIAVLAFSTVLLSGCSWLGFGNNAQHSGQQAHQGGQYHGQTQHGQYGQKRHNPCQVAHARAPLPQGCRPEQVTIGLQQPGYGQQRGYGQQQQAYGYGNQGYQTPTQGSYGQQAKIPTTGQYPLQAQVPNRFNNRPRLRLNGGVGVETSISGEAFSPSALVDLYNPAAHVEGYVTGTPPDGQVTFRDFSVTDVIPRAPQISYSDLYSAPISTSLGGEYFFTPRTSVTADASYTHAAGRSGGGITYEADLNERVQVDSYTEDPMTGAPVFAGTTINNTQLLNLPVAYAQYGVNDMKRGSLEVGAKHYFEPVFEQYMERPLIPYVGLSGGGAHYNATEVTQELYQLYQREYWDSGRTPAELNYYREAETTPVEVIEAGWVPTGTITVGAEWQVSQKASIGFETGVRYEGERDRTDGSTSGANYSIPLKIRGSIGF